MKQKLPNTLLLVAVLSIFLSCGEKEKTREVKPVEVKTLQIGASNSDQHERQISYSGTIQADKKVNLSFQVSGTLEQIPVSLGDFVEKGTLIAAVDPTTYQKQYDAKQAQAQLAQENYQRTNEVFLKGSVAEIKMIEARSKYNQAQSSATAAYQNVKHAKLFAPMAGYVGDKMMEAGDLAGPGKPVVQLLDIHSVKAIVPIPDEEINEYQVGNRAVVTIDALKGKKMEGNISEVSVNSSRGNPVYTAKINLNNPLKKIKPGMSCKVYLKKEAQATVTSPEFVIPIQSISVTEDGRNFVFVVNAQENKAEKRFVKTGRLYNNGIAISSGLQAGDKLVVSGYHKLTDQTPVKIAQ